MPSFIEMYSSVFSFDKIIYFSIGLFYFQYHRDKIWKEELKKLGS